MNQQSAARSSNARGQKYKARKINSPPFLNEHMWELEVVHK
jgi:hypothetical protein